MTMDKIRECVVGIVTTLYELESDATESTIYLAMGMNLRDYEDICNLLVTSDLVMVKLHRISLTEKGKALARDVAGIMAGAC